MGYNDSSFYVGIVDNVLKPHVETWKAGDEYSWNWEIQSDTQSHPIIFTVTLQEYAGFLMVNTNPKQKVCELRFYKSDVRLYFDGLISTLTRRFGDKSLDRDYIILTGTTYDEIAASLESQLNTTVSEVVYYMKNPHGDLGNEALWTAIFKLTCVIEHFNQSIPSSRFPP